MCGDLSLEKQTSISRTNMNPTTEEILPEKVKGKLDSIVVSVFVVILFEFDKYWKILNQKQIQITIWQWDELKLLQMRLCTSDNE